MVLREGMGGSSFNMSLRHDCRARPHLPLLRRERGAAAVVVWLWPTYADWGKVTATAAAGQATVSLTAHNTGRDGSLVLLYFAKANPGTIPVDEPASKLRWSLVHFERFDDVAGKRVETAFTLTPSHVTLVDKHGASKLWPGTYSVGVYTGADKSGPRSWMNFKCDDSGRGCLIHDLTLMQPSCGQAPASLNESE